MKQQDYYQILDSNESPLYGHLEKIESEWRYIPSKGNLRYQVLKGNKLNLFGEDRYKSAWITPDLPDIAAIDWEELTLITSTGVKFTLEYRDPN